MILLLALVSLCDAWHNHKSMGCTNWGPACVALRCGQITTLTQSQTCTDDDDDDGGPPIMHVNVYTRTTTCSGGCRRALS